MMGLDMWPFLQYTRRVGGPCAPELIHHLNEDIATLNKGEPTFFFGITSVTTVQK